MDDIHGGEALIKTVYEAIRNLLARTDRGPPRREVGHAHGLTHSYRAWSGASYRSAPTLLLAPFAKAMSGHGQSDAIRHWWA
jgi:hypothetical protein